MTTLQIVLVGLVVGFALWLILMYNRLITLQNRSREATSDIDVQLKRRYDLIPNLIETVKGYAAHEQKVFTEVTEARARAMGAGNLHDKAQAENMLSSTLKSLFAVAENYPQLQASQNFLELQRELRDTEDKIQAARRFFNSTVMQLNNTIESFPANMMARTFGFKIKEFFETEEESRNVPKVSFRN